MNYTALIDKYLDGRLPKGDGLQTEIFEAMRYAVLNGGKRVRPSLALEFCRVCGGAVETALPAACALECIHSYSLVHDDLPCMDDDDYRRGRPSTHKAYGEATALLAGDALLTIAFEMAAESQSLEAVSILAKAAGCMGMVGGQTLDLASEKKQIPLSLLQEIHAKKTGALLIAAAKLGVILAGGNQKQLEAARIYGQKTGRVFQIIDDILDVTGSFADLGKPIGSDQGLEKSTYVTHMGVDKAYALAEKLTQEAIEGLAVFGDNAAELKDFAEALLRRRK